MSNDWMARAEEVARQKNLPIFEIQEYERWGKTIHFGCFDNPAQRSEVSLSRMMIWLDSDLLSLNRYSDMSDTEDYFRNKIIFNLAKDHNLIDGYRFEENAYFLETCCSNLELYKSVKSSEAGVAEAKSMLKNMGRIKGRIEDIANELNLMITHGAYRRQP